MPLTRIDSAFLDLDAIGGIDFDVNNSVPTLKVDATTHRVGIGHNSPATQLHMFGSYPTLKIENSATAQYASASIDLQGPAGDERYTKILHGNSNTGGTETYFQIEQYDSLGAYVKQIAHYSYEYDYWAFSTGATGTEKLRIASDGQVGIATNSNLTAKLTVGNIENTSVTDKGATAFKTLNSSGGVGESAIYLEEQSGSEGWYVKVNSSGDLQFNDSGASDRITFQDGGNVGIGTDDPSHMLEIYGSAPTIELTDSDTGVIHRINANSGAGIWYFDSDVNDVGSDGTYVFRHGGNTIMQFSPSGTLTLGINSGTIRRSGDIDTYINFTGSDEIKFVTANSEQVRIDDTGSVGIGTDAPVQKLDVNGNIKSNNYLGPNTATGNAWFTVGTNTQNPSVSLWARDHTNYPGQVHILGRTSNASNIAGQIRFYQYTGSAWAITGMWGKNGYFGIRSSSSDPEVPLHIDNVSWGDRTAYLTKAADINFRLTAANGSGTNSSGEETARFGMNYASTNAWGEYIKFVRGTGSANGSMGFYSSDTERIHIKTDGNVGIGTNDPADKLHVLGSATISSDASAAGSQYATLVIGERPAADAYASIEFKHNANSISSKIDGRDGSFSIWAPWNSISGERFQILGTGTTEEVRLLPGNTEVISAEHDTSTGVSATYFAGTAHFQRTDTANEGGDIRFARAVDNAYHYSIDVYGNSTTNPRLRIVNASAAREDFHVSHAGNIGIGTNASSEKLTIHNGVVKLQGTSGGEDTRVEFNRIGGRNGWIGIPDWNDDALLIYGPGVSSGNFQAAGCEGGQWAFSGHNGTSSAEGLRIGQTGNVGIGTNNPTNPLHVQEKAYFRRGIQVTTLASNELQSRSPINSGFYNVDNASTSDGWPGPNGWHHLLANTHSNSVNYYSQQFASSFFNQELYFRNTNSSSTTASQSWGQVMHTNSTLKPVYAESDGSTDSWSRYFYPGGEYYTAVHSGTTNDFDNFKEQGYYHVNNTASNAPASGYGYLEIHRHQGSNYFTQKFTLSGDTSQTFMRRGSDSNGSQVFGSWNRYGSLERENTFTTDQNIEGVLSIQTASAAQIQVHGNANQIIMKPDSGSKPTVILRNDGSNYYTLLTNAGTAISNTWNGYRPFYINLTSGKLHSNNAQEFSGGTKVYSSMNLANIELDFTTANNKYIDFYTANGNTVNFRMPTTSNVFHTGIAMVRGGAVQLYHNNSLKLYTTSTGVYVNGSYQPTSDVNLKENIITVPDALDKIKAMRGVKFNWKKDGRPDYGVIAQEAETVVPELVADHEIKTLTQAGALKKRPDDSDYVTTTQKGFCYDSMVGILIEAIKEQQATIDSLTARIDALENQ